MDEDTVKINTHTYKCLTDQLIATLQVDKLPLGLASGAMGICIYLYYVGSEYHNNRYTYIAQDLLKHILQNASQLHSVDVKTGLPGIGLGIDYLVRNNYVSGNINNILSDADNYIFRKLDNDMECQNIDTLNSLYLLYYLCRRLKNLQNEENIYLFQALIRQLLNSVYKDGESLFCKEPLTYTIDYELPHFLNILSHIYELSFYNARLINMLDAVCVKTLSSLPYLHTNRLFLLWGLDKIYTHIKRPCIAQHINILRREVSIDAILHEELFDKNIFFYNGYASIGYIIHSLGGYFGTRYDVNTCIRLVIDKICDSSIWNALLNNDKILWKANRGLLNGFTGTIMMVDKLNKLTQ